MVRRYALLEVFRDYIQVFRDYIQVFRDYIQVFGTKYMYSGSTYSALENAVSEILFSSILRICPI